jgi:hypothetical protein
MREGDKNSNAILARIRQELGKLPLSEEEIAKVGPQIAASFLLRDGKITDPDSQFLDFRTKVNAVVEHFGRDGLTLRNYLFAAVQKPRLFYNSPATIIANIEGVAGHFRDHGLAISDLLRAAVKQPSLFYQSPTTIIANIEAVARYFRDHGLTISDHLRAAAKYPRLFCQSPATIISNVEGVAGHFREQGLTLRDYLHAATRQPPLFNLQPATVIANIEPVAKHFCEQGLTLPNYLQAAVKQPSLFGQSPETIIGHVKLLIDLHRQGLVAFPGEDSSPFHLPLQPLFDFLVNKPEYFCLADDNFTLREISARVSRERPSGTALLRRPRYQVESNLAETLGQSDSRAPVPKVPRPSEGSDLGPHARSLLLRALIREGIVKGTLER